MQSIGEVTTMFPIAGGFIEVRNSRFVSLIPWMCIVIDEMCAIACWKICGSCIQFLHGLALLLHVERFPWEWYGASYSCNNFIRLITRQNGTVQF
jgi:hypothetical protein